MFLLWQNTRSGIRRLTNPCITTYPAIVPTGELENALASGAMPRRIANPPRSRAANCPKATSCVGYVCKAARVGDRSRDA